QRRTKRSAAAAPLWSSSFRMQRAFDCVSIFFFHNWAGVDGKMPGLKIVPSPSLVKGLCSGTQSVSLWEWSSNSGPHDSKLYALPSRPPTPGYTN
uniref:Uncharacterized protein n=1 Tax=Cyprinodon variegatus TaxID=28743 RepID=A0A3Q2E887_CYPVA